MSNPARFTAIAIGLFFVSVAAPAGAEMDDDGTTPLDAVDSGRTDALDSVSTGHTNSLDAVEAERDGWTPPACSSIDVALGETPDGADVNAWSDVLFTAQKELDTSKYRLKSADDAYARAVNADYEVGSARARIIEARDEARANFARARCVLPELVERARHAGVPPGVLSRYEELPADIE